MPARTTNSFIHFGAHPESERDRNDSVRIATFNINNINKRLGNLLGEF